MRTESTLSVFDAIDPDVPAEPVLPVEDDAVSPVDDEPVLALPLEALLSELPVMATRWPTWSFS
jgi:hypothetical protein